MVPGTPAAFLSAVHQAFDPAWLERHSELHADYLQKQTRLWTAMVSGRAETLAEVEPGDRRFAHPEWHDNPYYDYLKQSYLLASRFLEQLVEKAQLEPAAKERARFAVRQWIDAMCPANFPATNPEALEEARKTQGESLARGLANLLADVQRRRISQTDESAFEVGRNIAITPGEVVFENELIQLIQYGATTPQVARRPLVMVPPCINKFYILDLQPHNSLVAHAVAAGNTVFMVSWRNVGADLGRLTWDDYLDKGVFTALRVAREISGADAANALGFCIGGTLLGTALGTGKSEGVASATFLTTMLDFSDTGKLGVFIDAASVAAREAAIGAGGIMPGAELDAVFSSLRPNDLVWPYVVNNYLKGARPAAFDLLHWNSDSTNLPGPMFCTYLRNTYLENKLCVPGAVSACGQPVDLGNVRVPVFVFSSREDHIVPWRSAYRTLSHVGTGDKTFVLGASGHIAGVINPPGRKRRSYWVGEPYPDDPEDWLSTSTQVQGSWWPLWIEWLARHAGGTRAAPKATGSDRYRPIEPAPGRYVKARIN